MFSSKSPGIVIGDVSVSSRVASEVSRDKGANAGLVGWWGMASPLGVIASMGEGGLAMTEGHKGTAYPQSARRP